MPTCTSAKCHNLARFEVLRLASGARWLPYCIGCTTALRRLDHTLRIRQIEVVVDDRARRRRLDL
jgi:hypothetical protein